MAFQGDSIYWVEVDKIIPNPFQPRREFNQDSLRELAESIRMYGVLQPLTVTRKEIQNEDGTFYTEYELIAGERRLRASKLAGVTQVPVIIRSGEQSEQEKLEIAIIENLQREDLNAVDRALAFKQLSTQFKLSHAQVAQKVGRSREYVSNTIRLLGLPEQILDALQQGEIMEGHARTLLMINDKPEEQNVIFREIILKKMSVREVEKIVRKIAKDKVRKQKKEDFDERLLEFEKKFTETLGTRVQIQKTPFGGKLTIDYFSEEDLNKLLQLIKEDRSEYKKINKEDDSDKNKQHINQHTPLVFSDESIIKKDEKGELDGVVSGKEKNSKSVANNNNNIDSDISIAAENTKDINLGWVQFGGLKPTETDMLSGSDYISDKKNSFVTNNYDSQSHSKERLPDSEIGDNGRTSFGVQSSANDTFSVSVTTTPESVDKNHLKNQSASERHVVNSGQFNQIHPPTTPTVAAKFDLESKTDTTPQSETVKDDRLTLSYSHDNLKSGVDKKIKTTFADSQFADRGDSFKDNNENSSVNTAVTFHKNESIVEPADFNSKHLHEKTATNVTLEENSSETNIDTVDPNSNYSETSSGFSQSNSGDVVNYKQREDSGYQNHHLPSDTTVQIDNNRNNRLEAGFGDNVEAVRAGDVTENNKTDHLINSETKVGTISLNSKVEEVVDKKDAISSAAKNKRDDDLYSVYNLDF